MARIRVVVLLVMIVFVAAACGGDGAGEESDTPTTVTPTTAASTADPGAAESAEEMAEELAEGLEETQQAVGGGGATLTVGDQTWTFDSVLCAFGEEMIGQEGAVFNLSSIQDGMQLYAAIDSFGHSVSLDDIEDFENPKVAVEAFGPGEFVVLDGKNVSATAEFFDDLTGESVQGTFEATCP